MKALRTIKKLVVFTIGLTLFVPSFIVYLVLSRPFPEKADKLMEKCISALEYLESKSRREYE